MPTKRRPKKRATTGGRRRKTRRQRGGEMDAKEYQLQLMDRLATWADKVYRHGTYRPT